MTTEKKKQAGWTSEAKNFGSEKCHFAMANAKTD
jgi:hypothetical protein